MRFLSNTHDPKDKNAPMFVTRSFHETQEQAWANHLEWLKGKVIGEPEATEAYTVEQLKEMGLVGVYMPNNSVHADAGDSAASSELVQASAESTSQTVTQATQRG